MAGTLSGEELARISDSSVDGLIEQIAHYPMGTVVSLSENGCYKLLRFPEQENAAMFLVSRLYTDAVFNNDIRAIQLIISRIDGGLPKDTEVDSFQTQFGDCLNEVMNFTSSEMIVVHPSDSVMMALCKSLYALATQDIYWDYERKKPCRPSTQRKQERDAAMRMILERVGGRKTLLAKQEVQVEILDADWIKNLPEST